MMRGHHGGTVPPIPDMCMQISMEIYQRRSKPRVIESKLVVAGLRVQVSSISLDIQSGP